MPKTKLLIMIPLLMLTCACSPMPASKKAGDAEPLTAQVKRLNDGEPQQSGQTSDGEPSASSEESDPKKTTEQIAAEIEAKYNDLIRDKYIFGISLGSLIALAVSFLAKWIVFLWQRKWRKAISDSASLSSQSLALIDAKVSEYDQRIQAVTRERDDAIKALNERYESICATLTERAEKAEASLADATERLSHYAEFGDKLDAVLEISALLSKSPDMVKSGVAAEIERIRKEVE